MSLTFVSMLINSFASGLAAFFAPEQPDRTWLCVGISPVW